MLPSTKGRRAAPVLFRKVALKIAGVVDNAPHLNHMFIAAAIEKKMPRRLYALALHSAPTELKMVRAGSFDHDLRAYRRSGQFGIFADIAQGLCEKRFIAESGFFPEFLFAPLQNRADIPPRFI